jgi:hypothetical protein
MPAKRNPHSMSARAWYGLYAWRKIAAVQLVREPWCRACLSVGRYERGWACDHINGFTNFDSFVLGPFQTLCRSCSNRKQQGQDLSWVNLAGERVDATNLPPPPITIEI